MSSAKYTRHESSAKARGASPWSLRHRVAQLAWELTWTLSCAWTPKPLHPWRRVVLRVFGARVSGRPFVHQRARIQVPWRLTLADGACIGERANLYTLDEISVGEGATVAQEAYLCAGTHDFADPALPLVTAPIRIEAHAFVGARAFVMPGVTVGARAIVGACAVVTKDIPPGAVCAGNPARVLSPR
jgi:putative colanic acid biosynthesis acetyltransferase WcaF